MKKVTLLITGLLVVSLGFSHTSYSGIEKSKSENNPTGVEVNVHSDIDVYGVQFDLSYDSNMLTLSSDNIISLVDPVNVYAKVIEPGKARVIMFSMQGDKIIDTNSDTASIIDIQFEALSEFSLGQSTVSLSKLILAGVNGIAIDCKTTSNFDLNIGLPTETSLSKNYPNPFNPSTSVPFNLKEAGYVSLKVYDMSGSLVKTLASDYREAGSYEVIWNGLNNDSQQVASGQYILQMNAPSFSNTLQMTFLK